MLLLLPPTRARDQADRGAQARAGGRPVAWPVRARRAGARATYDVEGTATEYELPPGRLER